MSLVTVANRREWLNSLLESASCGEIFASETRNILAQATTGDSPLKDHELLTSIQYFIDGDYMRAMVTSSTSRELFSIIRTEHTKAVERISQEKSGVMTFNWLQVLSIALYAWLSESSVVDDATITSREEKEMILLLTAISALNAYTQVNYTGIPLVQLPETDVTYASGVLEELLNGPHRTLHLSALQLNGEDVYSCLFHPLLLIIARAVLGSGVSAPGVTSFDVLKGVLARVAYQDGTTDKYLTRALQPSYFASPAVHLWALRALSSHQEALLDNTNSVRVELNQLFNQLATAYGIPALNNSPDAGSNVTESNDDDSKTVPIGTSPFSQDTATQAAAAVLLDPAYTHANALPSVLVSSVRASVCLEAARLARAFWQYHRSEKLMVASALLGEFRTQLTGVMGRRTRYQTKSYAQLMVVGSTDKRMLSVTPTHCESVTSSVLSDAVAPINDGGVVCVGGEGVSVARVDYLPDVPLDVMDDVYLAAPLLDHTHDHDKTSEPQHLSWLGQAATLAQAEHIRINNPTGELTTNEELAYVNATLTQHHRLLNVNQPLTEEVVSEGAVNVNGKAGSIMSDYGNVSSLMQTLTPWGVHTVAMHCRSRLELGDSRRQVRSLAQLETIGTLFRHDALKTLQHPSCTVGLTRVKMTADTIRANTTEEAEALMAELEQQDNTLAQSGDLELIQRKRLALTRWRLSGLFTSGCPAWWKHKRAYAELAVKAKLRQTALDAFVEIGLWEQVIDAYIELGRKAQAESLVRSRLPHQGHLVEVDGELDLGMVTDEEDNEPEDLGNTLASVALKDGDDVRTRFSESALLSGKSSQKKGLDLPEYKLWGLLGDLRSHPAYYLRAWELSKHQFPKVKRSLGRMYFVKREFAIAYQHYTDALNVNAATPEVWFSAGVCAMELKRFGDAIEAFSRTVSLQPDSSEGWNNLAACHLYCENNKSAFGALEHAVMLRRDSWKIWENYLNCALDLHEYQKACSALNRLCDLRGSTDSGTLLPIQYNDSQSQLHMYAAGELTKAAVEDAMKAFRKNVKNRAEKPVMQEFAATPSPVALQLQGTPLSHTNVPENLDVIEQSFLSFQTLTVLAKMDAIAGSMAAQENSMGGRKRGGGSEAGMANSLTAQLEHRERVNKEKAEKAAQQTSSEAEAKAKADAEGVEVEEDEEDMEEARDTVGELTDAIRERKPRHLESKMVAANQDLLYSLSKRFQVFICDCIARVNAGVQQYVPSAQSREKQVNVMMKEGSDWAHDADIIAEIEDLTNEAVRCYKLAADIEKSLGDVVVNDNTQLDANGCLTAARFFVNRVSSGLTLANKMVNTATIPPVVARLDALANTLKQEATPVAVAAVEAPRDEYSAYGGDSYDSYW